MHIPILGITRLKNALRIIVLLTVLEHPSFASQHYPTEFRPIFLIMVGHQRYGGIGSNVAQPLQGLGLTTLGLLVNRDVYRVLSHSKTNRGHVRDAIRADGCEPNDTVALKKLFVDRIHRLVSVGAREFYLVPGQDVLNHLCAHSPPARDALSYAFAPKRTIIWL